MIFDTDVIIWALRGNEKAATVIEQAEDRYIAVQTQIELIKGTKTKKELSLLKDVLQAFHFHVLPITEPLGYRALLYMENFHLGYGIDVGDAFIAATAMEYHKPLCTANVKHYKMIPHLKLLSFKV